MSKTNGDWNPFAPGDWAKALGLVEVPLFGPTRTKIPQGDHAVLLNGRRLSFAISSTDDPKFVEREEPLSWTWSSDLHHLVVIDRASRHLFLRNWSDRKIRRFSLPTGPRGAGEFLQHLHELNDRTATAPGVVTFLLRFFRQLRALLPGPSAIDSIRLLNALLVGAEAVRSGKLDEADWRKSKTVGDAVDKIRKFDQFGAGADQLDKAARSSLLGPILTQLLQPDPATGCALQPDLLLRHASGQLFQEAHLELERVNEPFLPGLANEDEPKGFLRPDVRFTPVSLARALVEQAFDARSLSTQDDEPLDILDPACGSGVFLQEALRELVIRRHTGRIHLRGFDTSDVSCAIAEFCLQRAIYEAKREANLHVQLTIKREDALQTAWGSPAFVLMNPPFVQWPDLDSDDRDVVRTVLGEELTTGRVDKAMAFVWKALQSVSPGAVVASVIPSPLLETYSGEKWRAAILQRASLRLVGRLEGYGMFTGALVEPAFVVLEQRRRNEPARARIRVVYAREGSADQAIRALRLGIVASPQMDIGAEVYEATPAAYTEVSWLPRPARYLSLINRLTEARFPTAGKLFEVKQGTLTGKNEVFLLSQDQYKQLRASERQFFRPIASNSTIAAGRIEEREYVFYPYGPNGATINDEQTLQRVVPTYYTKILQPNRPVLLSRARVDESNWWLLSEERSWQRIAKPKLVTTYFGQRGSFAYDAKGQYVVLQGYGWIWKSGAIDPDAEVTTDTAMAFHETLMPWAYLALLNTRAFEAFVAYACPRVQGGQFNLSKRFIDNVFLPDLSDEKRVNNETVATLARLGRKIHDGKAVEPEELDRAGARAYQLSVSDLELR